MTNAEIYAFIMIYKEMNISKAAEKLFISQSSLSTRIKTLERELGYQLFSRGKGRRKLTLTPEGEAFYKLASEYKEIVEKMFEIGGKRQSLRISSVDSLGIFILTSVYERFMAMHPDVVLEIEDMDTREAYENVENGFIDLAFYTNIKNFPKLKYMPVFSEEMVLICEKDSELPEIVKLSELDVKDEIYIPWSDTFVEWHNSFFGNKVKPYIKIELINQLEHFIVKKGAWAIVPSTVANGLVDDGNVTKKKIMGKMPKRMVFYSYMAESKNRELTYELLSCIKETIEELKDENIKLFI